MKIFYFALGVLMIISAILIILLGIYYLTPTASHLGEISLLFTLAIFGAMYYFHEYSECKRTEE